MCMEQRGIVTMKDGKSEQRRMVGFMFIALNGI